MFGETDDEMDGNASSAARAISSAITSIVKFAESDYEICAVDDQAKLVLQTVNQLATQLDNGRALRKQKASVFTIAEKGMIDEAFRQTEHAIQHFAAYMERARRDMEVRGGTVKVNTRLLYILRDSPTVHTSLKAFEIASKNLTAWLSVLNNREYRSSTYSYPAYLSLSTRGASRPPPTYEETMFFAERRLKNLQRRASAQQQQQQYHHQNLHLDLKELPSTRSSHSELPTTRSHSASSLISMAFHPSKNQYQSSKVYNQK